MKSKHAVSNINSNYTCVRHDCLQSLASLFSNIRSTECYKSVHTNL